MASGQPTVPLTMGLGSQAAGHREAIPPTGGSEPRRGHEAQTQGQYLNRGGNQAQSRQKETRGFRNLGSSLDGLCGSAQLASTLAHSDCSELGDGAPSASREQSLWVRS